VVAAQENTTKSCEVNMSAISGTIAGAVVSIVTLGAFELDTALKLELDTEDLLLNELSDDEVLLKALELVIVIVLTTELEFERVLVAVLELLSVTVELSADEVCGLVLLLVLAVKPLLLPPPPPPPPHALNSNITVAVRKGIFLSSLMLVMRCYLLRATAIDKMGLRQINH
jgi:hypothetical protein